MTANAPAFSDEELIARLRPPRGRVRAVLDTDTYNEIDDQFALAYACRADNFELEAVYAAPFLNARSSGPADGMEKSFEEIERVLERVVSAGGRVPIAVLRGSRSFLPRPDAPVESEAAADLVARARAANGPLYVLAIGAITNVASALLVAPEIRRNVVVVWLGGHPSSWHTAREFNLQQDLHASRHVLDCGVPLVRIPCKNVAEHLRVTPLELEHRMGGRNALCDYLVGITREYAAQHHVQSKVIWDIATVAWLRNPNWVPTRLFHSPILSDALTFSQDPGRHFVREAIDVERDAILEDVYALLTDRTPSPEGR